MMIMMMMMKSDPFTYYWQVKGTVGKRVVGKRGYTHDDDDDDDDNADDDDDDKCLAVEQTSSPCPCLTTQNLTFWCQN